MSKRVVITGMGILAPNGNSVLEYKNAIFNGKSGIDTITLFDPKDQVSKIAGEIKDLDISKAISPKECKRLDKYCQYALYAAAEAVKDSGIEITENNANRFGVIVGSGIGGISTFEAQYNVLLKRGPRRISPLLVPMMIGNMAAGNIAIKYGMKGKNFVVVSACASGTHAIGQAFNAIASGECDAMITGGTEAAITPLTVGGFASMKALSTRNDSPQEASRPFDKNRDGFVIGEGAGILVIESLESARSRNAKIYAELVGYGATADANHITAPSPGGEGAIRAIKLALESAKLNFDDIDYINAHGTSTSLNDKYETMAIKSVFKDHANKLSISSTKSMTGHLLGGAGAIEAVASVLAINNSLVPPTINYETPDPECDLNYTPNKAQNKNINAVISNSFGFGGQNAVIAIKKFA